MKEKMLKPIRVKMGLGNPPKEFNNNENESANARIKEKANYKRSELNIFCGKMKELVDRQTRNIERAFTMDMVCTWCLKSILSSNIIQRYGQNRQQNIRNDL